MSEIPSSAKVNCRFYNVRVTLPGDPLSPIDFEEIKFILNQYKDGEKSFHIFPNDQMIVEVTNSWGL